MAMCILLVGVAYTLFFFNQDFIRDEVVLRVNRSIQGRLQLDKIGLSLFSSLPNITLNLKNVRLYEEKTAPAGNGELPVIHLGQLKVSLNLRELLDDHVMVEKVFLDGGRIDLTSYTDATMNLTRALQQESNARDTPRGESDFSLHLKLIEVQNVHVHHHDELSHQYLATTVKSLLAKFKLEADSVNGSLNLDYQLDSLLVQDKNLMRDHNLKVKTDFTADLGDMALSFTEGNIRFDLLDASFSGHYNYADSGFVDLSIVANHEDLSKLAKMNIFNADYLPDIRGGRLILSTTLKGKTMGKMPQIVTMATLTELHVHNRHGDVIEDSGFRLMFYNGIEPDMRDGILYIDNVDVNFASGGFLSGNMTITNFAEPTYKINWQLAEELADLQKIFVVPGIKKMQGMVRSQARLKGNFNLQNWQFGNPEGIFRMQFENCRFVLEGSQYEVKELDGQLFMNEGEVSVDNLTFNANNNELKLNAKVKNLVPYLLGSPARLTGDLAVHTHALNTFQLLAFSPAWQEQVNYRVDSLDLVVQADFLSTAIDSFNLIPAGRLTVANLTAKVDGLPLINRVNGNIIIRPDTLQFKQLSGYVGESPLSLNLTLANYDGYFQTDSVEGIALALALQADKLVAKDFFTLKDEFLLPASYQHEVLENVAFNVTLATTNRELQKTGLFPEFSFQVTGLKFKTHFSPVKFRDIGVFGAVKDNNIYINSLFGKFGRSDVFMNAEFTNVLATQDTLTRPFKSRISLNSQVLDLDELIKLSEADKDHQEAVATGDPANPYADDYPITDLNVNIGKLVYFGVEIKDLSGILNMEDHNIIKLDHVKLRSGTYGSFEFDGIFDASSHREAILTAHIKVTDVDLSKLDVTYLENGEEVKVGDHLAGIFNGEIEANVPVTQDFNFDLARLTGSIKAVVKDGALRNYPPLMEMGKYFKNKDLSNVQFADMMNTMVFKQGKMHLPFMTINSTLGTIFLMGYQTIDDDMEFDVQVPVKLVAGAVLNSLFAGKKGDDGKEDVISSGPKGKYVTVHIYGHNDEYRFKIGKKHGEEAAAGLME